MLQVLLLSKCDNSESTTGFERTSRGQIPEAFAKRILTCLDSLMQLLLFSQPTIGYLVESGEQWRTSKNSTANQNAEDLALSSCMSMIRRSSFFKPAWPQSKQCQKKNLSSASLKFSGCISLPSLHDLLRTAVDFLLYDFQTIPQYDKSWTVT